MISVFGFEDYKKYLNERIRQSENKGRGVKKKLAEAINCQPAFISQVLNGNPDFSLEQGVVLNGFLNHTEAESNYFMVLLQLARAGNNELKKFFTNQLDAIKEKQFSLKDRIGVSNTLDELAHMTYYSAWYYAAVHMLVSVPHFNSPEKIARALEIDPLLTKNVIQFLLEKEIITEGKNSYDVGLKRIHLAADSAMIMRHHNNWRTRAMTAIDHNNKEDLHYSLVFTTSEKDIPKIKEVLVESIQKVRGIFRESKDEKAVSLVIDLFDLVKKN
jgi:uncharacterized protein (TIGR02147 family)